MWRVCLIQGEFLSGGVITDSNSREGELVVRGSSS